MDLVRIKWKICLKGLAGRQVLWPATRSQDRRADNACGRAPRTSAAIGDSDLHIGPYVVLRVFSCDCSAAPGRESAW